MSDDGELLRAWGQGDQASGEKLYRLHFRLVYAFFRSKLSEEVEDLVQTTFMTVHRRADKYRGGSMRAFILGVGRYELLDHLRRKARRDARIEPTTASIHDLATSASSVLRREQTHDRLREALQALPLDQQIALELRYWHELSTEEIAEVQDVATATVRTRLHRAREALGALVGADEMARFDAVRG